MPRRALIRILRYTAWAAALLLALGLLVLLGRAFEARRGPPLQPWHTMVLQNEVSAGTLGATATWGDYLAQEDRLFREVRQKLAAHPVPGWYRYEADSRIGPRPGERDWNRSFELFPTGEVRGGVLMLHGLTDSPYSMRSLAALYQRAGFVVVVPRLPGHGTVPAGLLHVQWQDWMAVTRMAMRELRTRTGPGKPLQIVGYSNGAALAVKYAMDVAARPDGMPQVRRLVLLSPMIGVTPGARFARLLPIFGWIPYFAQSNWLDVLPEFNPFKYNSFPVNGAVQSYLLTAALKAQLLSLEVRGRETQLPPILAFQSVLDATVSTRAVVDTLFDHLPRNGSELVLLDINRAALLAPMLRRATIGFADALDPDVLHDYRLTLISNRDPRSLDVAEYVREPGERAMREHPLPYAFPQNVYSLSHVALPFPMDDPVYGLDPRKDENYGIRLGTLALHGERGALLVSIDQLERLGCNPFFPYLAERILPGNGGN